MIAWLMLKTTRFGTDEAKNIPAAPNGPLRGSTASYPISLLECPWEWQEKGQNSKR